MRFSHKSLLNNLKLESIISSGYNCLYVGISDHQLAILSIILSALGIIIAYYLGGPLVKKFNLQNKKEKVNRKEIYVHALFPIRAIIGNLNLLGYVHE